MQDEDEVVIARWLGAEGSRPVPLPSADLVSRTLQRVRSSVLLGDLLRLMTFEGFWSRAGHGRVGAETPGERQDP